jgi:hypothetical protein
MAALFTALDVTGLETSISTLLLAGVGIALLYIGYKHVKRAGSKV